MLRSLIQKKACSTEPTFATYEDLRKYSYIQRLNLHPYPYYFVGQPFSDEPVIHSRCAGWSAEVLFKEPKIEIDPYPKHCFEAACNTQYTKLLPIKKTQTLSSPSPSTSQESKSSSPANPKKEGPVVDGKCSNSNCINLYR